MSREMRCALFLLDSTGKVMICKRSFFIVEVIVASFIVSCVIRLSNVHVCLGSTFGVPLSCVLKGATLENLAIRGCARDTVSCST